MDRPQRTISRITSDRCQSGAWVEANVALPVTHATSTGWVGGGYSTFALELQLAGKEMMEPCPIRLHDCHRFGRVFAGREMMEPCVVHLHAISLVARGGQLSTGLTVDRLNPRSIDWNANWWRTDVCVL